MDMETLLPQVANYGFPMVLSWYLLVRMESRLDRLTDSINSLARSIAAGKTA
ncbi:YvrJ family protein [Phascolarctobacterium faecium]|uniref:YvrJ family protein n=1 Tax=Phascolarctobacterium faecium TaxID=33025 RepID=UPI003AF034F9